MFAAIAVFVCVGSASAPAQAQQARSCSGREFRQLDFWVGVWDLRWEAASGIPAGRGVNTITRAYGDCVIQEDFVGGGLIGHSVSTYHAPSQHWRQTWVDNQGGYFALVGGPEGQDFVLLNSRNADTAPMQRMVFTDISSDSLTWRWQRSADGGATWSDQWVVFYARRSP